jgi:type IV secretion system protein VirD4
VQASSQLDTVNGSAYARELRDTLPAALVTFGAAEMELLQRAEEWTQETTRRSETFDQAAGAKMFSPQLGSTLEYRRLLPDNRDNARLLLRGTAGVRAHIPDCSGFVELLRSGGDGLGKRFQPRPMRA